MSNKTKFSTLKLTIIGLMAAMVFVATNFRIEIPTPLGPTMLHLGNVMCVLSGLLFGPITGGLSAGFGSAMFDLFNPTYAPEAWIVGAFTYVILYTCKTFIMNYFIIGDQFEAIMAVTITKATVSATNAIVAIIASIALVLAIRPALKAAGIFNKLDKAR